MRIPIVVAVFIVLGSPNPLEAAPKPPTPQSRERLAKKACATTHYQEGVEILAELYVDTNDPTYVFNQGRCYEQNRRLDEAIDRFREYLRKAINLTAEERADVNKHIADCESLLPKPVVAPTPTPPLTASEPAPAPRPAPLVETAAAPASAPAGSGSRLRVAGLATAAVGAAAIATGVVFTLRTKSISNDIETSGTGSYAARESTRASYETWGWVAYGAGAAAVATGAVLYILGRNHDGSRSKENISLSPAVVPGEAKLILRGEF